jgi:hypothetical protein
METVNIINNFNNDILMENIIILNQKKLLDMIIISFEDSFKNILSDDLVIQNIIEFFNELSYINWNLFIKLINLKTPFEYNGKFENKFYSLTYILTKILCNTNYTTNFVEFLLRLPKGLINWEVKGKISKNNTLMMLLGNTKFKNNPKIINYILESDLFDESMWYEKNLHNLNPINILLNYPEEIISKAFDLNKFNFNHDLMVYRNHKQKSFRIINYLIEKEYLSLVKKIFKSGIELKYNYNKTNTDLVIHHIIINSICWTNNLEFFKLAIEYGLNFINPYDKELQYNNWIMWDSSLNFIKKEEIILYLVENKAIELNEIIFNKAVKNNWKNILKIYFDSKKIENILEENNNILLIPRLLYNKNYNYFNILLFETIKKYWTNLIDNLNQEYLYKYGFDEDNYFEE